MRTICKKSMAMKPLEDFVSASRAHFSANHNLDHLAFGPIYRTLVSRTLQVKRLQILLLHDEDQTPRYFDWFVWDQLFKIIEMQYLTHFNLLVTIVTPASRADSMRKAMEKDSSIPWDLKESMWAVKDEYGAEGKPAKG
jgi:hypothetical protein